MAQEWCCEKLKDLKIEDRRLTALSEIRVRLNAAESLQNITATLLNLPEIRNLFDCLENSSNTNEGEGQFELASDILTICMANISINDNNFDRTALHRALEHENANIRALALNAIFKELQRYDNPQEFQLTDDTLLLVLKSIKHSEISVGGPAISILSYALINKAEDVKQSILDMHEHGDETIRCRIYEMAVKLAKHSPSTLEKVTYLLDLAIAELSSDDILVQVNIMEILVQLAEQNHSLLFLERRKVFEAISGRVEKLQQNPIDRLLVPGIMKFFGKSACSQPTKIIAGYPHMVNCLFDCIRSDDITVLPVAFDTFANLASTNEGKLLLEAKHGEQLLDIFQNYASYLSKLSSELKNRAFNSLEIIFTANMTHADEIGALLNKWFTYLAGSSNMQFLMDFCRNPFPDIKVACLAFIKAVCKFSWGIEALKNTAGFLEYLLDRKIEFDMEAKFAKYELIKILADSALFDVQTHLQLQTYIKEGPCYVQTLMEVAVERNS